MKRALLTLGLTVSLATPATGQWLGEPAWNHPNAGTGFTIYGDYTQPSREAGGREARGGRLPPRGGKFSPTRRGAALEGHPPRHPRTPPCRPPPPPVCSGRPP